MTQFTITVTDPKEASLIKKLLAKFDSVTITKPAYKRKTGLDEALKMWQRDVYTKHQAWKIYSDN